MERSHEHDEELGFKKKHRGGKNSRGERARASQSQEDKVGIELQEVRLDRYFASEIKAHQLAGIRFLYSHVVVGLKNLREVISS